MERQTRAFRPYGTYYVRLSSGKIQSLYVDARDCRNLLGVIGRASDVCKVTVHAFCVTKHELRLVVELSDVPLEKFLRRLTEVYARYLRRRWRRSCALFVQHYATLVDESAFPRLVRYLHCLPVLMQIVEEPADYPWSSDHVYRGVLHSARWLVRDKLFHHIGSDRRAAYRTYMWQEPGECDVVEFERAVAGVAGFKNNVTVTASGTSATCEAAPVLLGGNSVH
jgi:REP element-mobilizing transposase RayT